MAAGKTMSYTMSDKWIQDFVALIESATIGHNSHEQAKALKNDYLPSKLYKYRSDDDWSRLNLENDLIRMACPDNFNDPYDCSFKIDAAQALAQYKQTVFAMTLAIATFADEAKMSKTINAGIKALNDFRSAMKVCCFSEGNDSLLMWGHYASDHKGFCIEYDLESLAATEFLRQNLYPVLYSKDLYDMTPLVKGAVSKNRDDFPLLAPILSVLRKFEGWSYEHEWRVVRFHTSLVADYNEPVPKANKVFLGSKMEAAAEQHIAGICASKGIEVFKMDIKKDRFELFSYPYVAL